jgi:hypothetical protein
MISLQRLVLASLGLVFLSAAANAEWTVRLVDSEPGRGGIEHRHLILESTRSGERAMVEIAIFSPKSCTLRVIENERGSRTLAEAMKPEKCLAGTNGGYFDAKFNPIGLRINNGETISPLRRARLLTGVLAVSPHQVEIMRTREFSPKQKLLTAIQCGPFLVDLCQAVRGLDDSRLARRTFAATSTGGRAALGVCSDISLADLAMLLATTSLVKDFKMRRALNLDGGSSTAFWFARANNEAFSIPEQKPVRDFVAIVPQ